MMYLLITSFLSILNTKQVTDCSFKLCNNLEVKKKKRLGFGFLFKLLHLLQVGNSWDSQNTDRFLPENSEETNYFLQCTTSRYCSSNVHVRRFTDLLRQKLVTFLGINIVSFSTQKPDNSNANSVKFVFGQNMLDRVLVKR